MASTFTSRGIERPASGDYPGLWAGPVNDNWTLIDALISGQHVVTLTVADVVLTAAQSRNSTLILSGAPTGADRHAVVTNVPSNYVVLNTCTGNFRAGVKTAAGTAVYPPPNVATVVFCDGSGNFQMGAPGGVPIGTVVDYGGLVAPAGWVLCDGSAVARLGLYAGLFAVIGEAFGEGDGSTTFNLPDLRGRVTAGDDNMGGSTAGRLTDASMGPNAVTMGAWGGHELVTLSTDEMPSHSHVGTAAPTVLVNPTYSSPIGAAPDPALGFLAGTSGNRTALVGGISTVGSLDHTHVISIGNAGGGLPHSVVQPTIIISKMIRYL